MTSSASIFKNDRILITGAGGVLGSALRRLTAEMEIEALLAPTRTDCDLMDAKSVTALFTDFRPTIVLHLAGRVSGVQGNITFAGAAFYENAMINLNVVEAARLAGCRKVVAAGTTAIYSDAAPLPMKESDLWLGPPHGSEGPYGHAKRAMFAHLEAYAQQYGLDFGYMICTNLYGPNDRFDEVYGHVVPSLISRFHNAVQTQAPSVTIWGDGSPTRDFLFADDAASAFLTVAAHGSGAYNTATGRSLPIRDLVEAVRTASGFQGEILWDTDKPKGQLRRAYDVTRLSDLGWAPKFDLNAGVKATYDWFAQNTGSVRR
jgi:GDP-L-fucose synthase